MRSFANRVGVGACVVAAAFASLVRDARADLRATATRVADEWKKVGAVVTLGAARFLHDDETITVVVPPAESPRDCTTVLLLGARGTTFHARVVGAEEGDTDDPSARGRSVAGALTLSRCGAGVLRRISVTNDAGRGAIETIIGRSAAPLPPVRAILPERTGVSQPPAPEPGDLPALPGPDKRAELAEARARRDGGKALPRESVQAGPDGNGAAKAELEPGCHRIELFPQDPRTGRPSRRGKIDLDGELRDESDERLLSRDRTDAPDAHLEVCVGEATHAGVTFAGSPPSSPVLMTHVMWAIPEHLPAVWGPEARARMASAILGRHVASPRRDPVFLAQGGSGQTPVPLSVEPGGCYVAVVAIVQGTARGVGIRAVVGARESADDRSSSDNAGVVAFCAQERSRASIELDARGTGVAWGLSVFRVQGGVWDGAR